MFTMFASPAGEASETPSLVLILKWGGELTPAGRIQAEELGRIFRCMYPGGQGRFARLLYYHTLEVSPSILGYGVVVT